MLARGSGRLAMRQQPQCIMQPADCWLTGTHLTPQQLLIEALVLDDVPAGNQSSPAQSWNIDANIDCLGAAHQLRSMHW